MPRKPMEEFMLIRVERITLKELRKLQAAGYVVAIVIPTKRQLGGK